MEELAPLRLAQSWDNVGLQLGQSDWPVKRIMIALDPLPQVVSDALKSGIDLLITHHPFFFRPLKCIDPSTPLGSSIALALFHKLGIYSSHTNLDACLGGLNDMLAQCL